MSLIAHGIVAGIPMKASLKGLAHELAEYHNKDTGLCCPSVDKLASNLCCTVRNIQLGLRQLEEAGLIRREDRFSEGRQTTSNYVFCAKYSSPRPDAHFIPEGEATFIPEGEASFTQNQKKEPEEVTVGRRFAPPTTNQVAAYAASMGYRGWAKESHVFVDFYAAKGWVVGKSPMRDWKAAVRNWERRDRNDSPGKSIDNDLRGML